jgi:DNA-3-methyladenine glycosylase
LAASPFPALPQAFFARPAEVVAPELIGCLLVQRPSEGEPLWGVIVETEAYSQAEPACHGHRRRSPQNETLFGPPGHFYVYVSYGIHHCVNVVTDRADWANGVLLRALALPGEPERVAAGPGLLSRRFGIDRHHNAQPVRVEQGLWLAPRPAKLQDQMVQWAQEGHPVVTATTRIGIREGQELPWRWYLAPSRSVSRRARGDATPPRSLAWEPQGWLP